MQKLEASSALNELKQQIELNSNKMYTEMQERVNKINIFVVEILIVIL